jgi:hypothetical protein
VSDGQEPANIDPAVNVTPTSITATSVEGELRLVGAASPQELKAATAARKHQLD